MQQWPVTIEWLWVNTGDYWRNFPNAFVFIALSSLAQDSTFCQTKPGPVFAPNYGSQSKSFEVRWILYYGELNYSTSKIWNRPVRNVFTIRGLGLYLFCVCMCNERVINTLRNQISLSRSKDYFIRRAHGISVRRSEAAYLRQVCCFITLSQCIKHCS